MAEKTELQQALTEDKLCRNFYRVQQLFLEGNIELWTEIDSALKNFRVDKGQDFVLLDAGCGSGACIEELLRILKRRFSKWKDKIRAVGIDFNPLPEMIPEQIFKINPDRNIRSVIDYMPGVLPVQQAQVPDYPLAELRKGDITAPDLPDNSIDIGYSIASLIYVTDSLKALSEGYRVLKLGGKFFWEICNKNISIFPDFNKILEATPGAKGVFKYKASNSDAHTGFVICTKAPGIKFKGFDYEVAEELLPTGDNTQKRHRAFYRNAVYKALPIIDLGVGLGKPSRRRNKTPEQRFEQFLKRILKDVQYGRFPINYRAGDCERFNWFPIELNTHFESNDIDGLRVTIMNLVRVLMSIEEAN